MCCVYYLLYTYVPCIFLNFSPASCLRLEIVKKCSQADRPICFRTAECSRRYGVGRRGLCSKHTAVSTRFASTSPGSIMRRRVQPLYRAGLPQGRAAAATAAVVVIAKHPWILDFYADRQNSIPSSITTIKKVMLTSLRSPPQIERTAVV